MDSFFSCFVKRPRSSRIDGPKARTKDDVQRYPKWLNDILEYHEKAPLSFHPTVTAFGDLIESNARVRLLASGMCDELAVSNADSSRIITTYQDMLRLLNYVVRVPPLWDDHMFTIGLEAAPFYLLLEDIMHTECGFAFFQDPDVNIAMKNILDAWGLFLASPGSVSCLDDSPTSWFSDEARASLVHEANLSDDKSLTFEDLYVCDPTDKHHGFRCWDDFFTRQFREGVRPVADPQDDYVVANVCEAQPWRIAKNVKWEDHFWAKGGAYSLRDMLASDDLGWHFIGGTVYQAYLSALAYHRWHSPVTGRVVRTAMVPGLYFSEPLNRGFGGNDANLAPNDTNWEQAYLAAIATRAVIYIEADNPSIGLMAVIFIGMQDVSTCEFTVTEGQRVEKGQQLGMFHFGGSTHCVLFRPCVQLSEMPDTQSATRNIAVRGKLARVAPHMDLPPAYAEKQELLL